MSDFELQQSAIRQAEAVVPVGDITLPPTGSDVNAARKKGSQAEMAFRISKGYEKDNLWTRIKYLFKEKF